MGETAHTPTQPGSTPGCGRHRGLRRFIGLSSLLYLVFLVVLAGILHLADRWWLATLFMFGPGWLLVLPLTLLIPSAAVWRRRSLGPLALALVLTAWVTDFSLPTGRLSQPTGIRLRLLTCNLHYAEHLDPDPLNRFLAETQPDITLLQEWDHPDPSTALVLPDGWHTHQTPQQISEKNRTTADRFVLASRFPIRQATVLGRDSMNTQGMVVRYELETPVGLVTVFNLHFASPRAGLQACFRGRREGPALVQRGSDLRREQSEFVAQEANRIVGPVLLAGDFNTPPQSVLFRRTWGRYSDAFSSGGWGWGGTFFSRTATVRIDHILVGPGWHCPRCWAGPDVGSPHHPVIADLVWSPAE